MCQSTMDMNASQNELKWIMGSLGHQFAGHICWSAVCFCQFRGSAGAWWNGTLHPHSEAQPAAGNSNNNNKQEPSRYNYQPSATQMTPGRSSPHYEFWPPHQSQPQEPGTQDTKKLHYYPSETWQGVSQNGRVSPRTLQCPIYSWRIPDSPGRNARIPGGSRIPGTYQESW